MKTILINLVVITALLCTFISCSGLVEVDGDYGNTLIYMPQATHNIGVDNNLVLTIKKTDTDTDSNYKTSTTLGIYRSGIAPKKSVSVDLLIDVDSLNYAISEAQKLDSDAKYSIYKNGVLLDKKYYNELPGTLTIPDGAREATTQLVLNNKAIFDAYFGEGQPKILFLPVRITNPTKYELNQSLSLTMVVINLVE